MWKGYISLAREYEEERKGELYEALYSELVEKQEVDD